MKPAIAIGKCRITEGYKERISDTHYIWHFMCQYRRGKLQLLAKYPIGKEYTERVKKLIRREYVAFEADIVNGRFYITNIRADSFLGDLTVQILANGKIVNFYPFGNGCKLVVSTKWGTYAFIDSCKSKSSIGDLVAINGTIANGQFIAQEVRITSPVQKMLDVSLCVA